MGIRFENILFYTKICPTFRPYFAIVKLMFKYSLCEIVEEVVYGNVLSAWRVPLTPMSQLEYSRDAAIHLISSVSGRGSSVVPSALYAAWSSNSHPRISMLYHFLLWPCLTGICSMWMRRRQSHRRVGDKLRGVLFGQLVGVLVRGQRRKVGDLLSTSIALRIRLDNSPLNNSSECSVSCSLVPRTNLLARRCSEALIHKTQFCPKVAKASSGQGQRCIGEIAKIKICSTWGLKKWNAHII